MSEELKRVQIEDNQAESITGGTFYFYSNPVQGYYCEGDSEPGVKYGYDIKNLVRVTQIVRSYSSSDDAAILAALRAEDLIYQI